MGWRGGRIPIALALLALVLVLGRWSAAFLADRWWRAAISSGAAAFGTSWALVGLGLALAATFLAFFWFGVNFLIAMGSGLSTSGASPSRTEFLATVSESALRWGTVGAAAILAWFVGSGAGQWTGPVLLASHGVRFGVGDPALGHDLGVYLTAVPVWRLLNDYVMTLAIIGFLGVCALYVFWGAIGVSRSGLRLTPAARRHTGLLAALVAGCIAWNYLIEPYRHAAGLPEPLAPSQIALLETVSVLLAGTASAVSILTAGWAFRGRLGILLSAWLVLGAGMSAGRLFVPEVAEGPSGDDRFERARLALEGLAYGLSGWQQGDSVDILDARPLPSRTVVPSIWTRTALSRAVPGDTTAFAGAARGLLEVGGGEQPVWWVFWRQPDSSVAFGAVADQVVGERGAVQSYRPEGPVQVPGIVPFGGLVRSAVRPRAPPLIAGPGVLGVPIGGLARRIALAWSLQAGWLLGADPVHQVAWNLEPDSRLQAVAPFVSWSQARFCIVRGQPLWVAGGMVTAQSMPAVRRIRWKGRDVALAREDFLGIVHAQTGAVTIVLREGASALGRVWAELAVDIVATGETRAWKELERQHLPSQEAIMAVGSLFGNVLATGEADPVVVPVMSYRREALKGFLQRIPGGASWWPADSLTRALLPEDLSARWARLGMQRQVADSIRATGGHVVEGPVRYEVIESQVMAYQPWYALGPRGRLGLALVNLAAGDRFGTGRTLVEAIDNLRGAPVPEVGSEPGSVLDQARVWMAVADSALRRGDLATFGRAFQALRQLLAP